MANFCFASVTDDSPSSAQIDLADTVQFGLWGGGPMGEELDIVVNGPPIVKLDFPTELQGFPDPNLRVFELTGVSVGRTTLEARAPRTGGLYASPLQVTVGAGHDDLAGATRAFFYHGASLQRAKELMMMELVPFAVMEAWLLDLNEYTDFGKGFYTHPEESKGLAVKWAKRKNPVWGVVRFTLTAEEISRIRQVPMPLHFPDKFTVKLGYFPEG
jgi:hypothetical protein